MFYIILTIKCVNSCHWNISDIEWARSGKRKPISSRSGTNRGNPTIEVGCITPSLKTVNFPIKHFIGNKLNMNVIGKLSYFKKTALLLYFESVCFVHRWRNCKNSPSAIGLVVNCDIIDWKDQRPAELQNITKCIQSWSFRKNSGFRTNRCLAVNIYNKFL